MPLINSYIDTAWKYLYGTFLTDNAYLSAYNYFKKDFSEEPQNKLRIDQDDVVTLKFIFQNFKNNYLFLEKTRIAVDNQLAFRMITLYDFRDNEMIVFAQDEIITDNRDPIVIRERQDIPDNTFTALYKNYGMDFNYSPPVLARK